jgi:peptide/nickel transport system substrate-binding protein
MAPKVDHPIQRASHSTTKTHDDDIVATINYHGRSKSPAKIFCRALPQSRPTDRKTVVVDSNPVPDSYLLTDYHLPIYSSNEGKIEWEKGIGAGPYILKSYEPGVKLTAERNPNYFKDTWFDAVEMLTIADVAARTNAYISGEVHFMDRADLKTIDMLKNAPYTEIYNQSGPTPYTAPMLCDVAPFDNADVRMALKYAINRQELVTRFCSDMASPVTTA